MHFRSRLILLPFLVVPQISNAAMPMPLEDFTLKDIKQRFHLSLPVPGVTNPVTTAINSLKYIQERIDQNQITHIRMQQEYFGFMVFKGYAIMHSSKPADVLLDSQAEVRMTGTVFRGLEEELGRPPKNFVQRGDDVLAKFKAMYEGEIISESQVTPIVYIDDDNKAYWAYKISMLVEYEDKMPERPTAIVDASNYAPFVQWNNIKTAKDPAKGLGYGGNPKTKKYEFGTNIPYLSILRDADMKTCYMENANTKVVDMKNTYRGVVDTMKFPCIKDVTGFGVYWTGYKEDGYDVNNLAYSPSNDALYIGDIIDSMFKKWYGFSPLTRGGKPFKLVMRVHYGKNYENAFWDGTQMTFGDGGKMLFPLVSIGVGAHEISHGFTEQHSKLVYYGQSGGMNESFSDMAAQAAEYFVYRNNSWKIGSEVLKHESGYDAIRYMDRPSRDGYSIDSADQYRKGLDVHYSSGVYNRLFYLLATKNGWNVRKAFNVMVKANMDYWTPYSTFEDGACGILSAAQDLEYSLDDIKEVLNEVVVNYSQCDRYIL